MSAKSVRSIDPLNALADHCLRARELADQLEANRARGLIDLLLREIGFLIAADLARQDRSDAKNNS